MRKKFHSFQQIYSTDCGQTCIRMIANFYGLNIDYKYLCSLADYDRQGMSIFEIIRLLNTLNFDAVGVRLSLEQLEKLPLPAILFWNQAHYVVLYRIDITKGVFYIADPALGKARVKKEEFILKFCGNIEGRGSAIAIDPNDNFSTEGFPKNHAFKGLLTYLKGSIDGYRHRLGWIILMLIFILLTDLAFPFLFQTTIDKGIQGKDVGLIWLLAASQIAIFLGNYISNSFVDLILTKLGLKVGINMLNNYLDKLLHLPMNFYSRHSPADLVQRTDDQNRIKQFLMSMPTNVVLTILNLLIFSGIMVWYSPLIFFIFVILSVLNIGWMSLFLRFRREIDFPLAGKLGENRNNLFEIIGGIEEIKSSRAQEARISGWRLTQEHINNLTLKSAFLKIYQNGGNMLMVRVRDAVITGICAVLVTQDAMTIGIMMTVSYIAGYLAQPFSNIISSVNSVQDSIMAYQRLDGIIHCPSDERKDCKIQKVETLNLDHVTFKYPGATSPLVLNECSLQIEVGKSLAIVGESGCGKSTLLKLLTASYLPSTGKVSVNEYPLTDVEEDSFTSQFGIVMQNGTIYSTTILENIGFSDLNPDMDKVKEAARMACIDSFIESLPMGYNTRIGSSGLQLSGGQRQRIFIARALYRNPPILILDEATSSLDAITESRIMDNVFRYCKGRTLIIAAHRLSTVSNADKIVVMSNGKIAEEGTHSELMGYNGIYAGLIKKQIPQSEASDIYSQEISDARMT